MIKVKITRGCSIEGKHYGVGDVAEVIEKGVDEDGIHTITARVEVKVGKVTVRQTQELLTQHS